MLFRSFPGINLVGDLCLESGLGEVTRSLLIAIQHGGVPVSYIEYVYDDLLHNSDRRTEFLELSRGHRYEINLISIGLRAFSRIDELTLQGLALGRYTIAYWLWELPEIPNDLLPQLERVDEIWVASHFVQEIFQRVTNRPVRVIPPVVELDPSGKYNREFYNIPSDRYVFFFNFSVSSSIARKNVFGLIEAFHQAFDNTEDTPILVLKAHGLDDVPQIRSMLQKRLKEIDGLLLDGLYSREQMIDLLNCCDAYISLHRAEGFGLGLAEAMYLGKPVIATGYSSNLDFMTAENCFLVDFTLREITEEDHIHQPDLISVLSPGQLWAEPNLYHAATLMRHLYASTQDYKIELGEKAASTIRRLYSAKALSNQIDMRLCQIKSHLRPLRIAFWTPLPPIKSGIADYSVELLEALSALLNCDVCRSDIEVFIDTDYKPDTLLVERYAVFLYTDYDERNRANPYDINLYQMGASFSHLYIYEQLQRVPGIVVLHDLSLSYLLFAEYFKRQNTALARSKFEQELLYAEGQDALQAFQQFMGSDGAGNYRAQRQFLSQFMLSRRVIENSLAQMVHMPYAADLLQERYRKANPYVIYQAVQDPLEIIEKTDIQFLRSKYEINGDDFVIGIFGLIDPVKQVVQVLAALQELIIRFDHARLLIVGETTSPEYLEEIKAFIASRGIKNHVVFAGYVEKDIFLEYMILCDVIINLREASGIQMSAILLRAIAAGKPIIITDLPEWRFIPESFCDRVLVDKDVVSQITKHVTQLIESPELGIERSIHARQYFETELRSSTMAMRIHNMIHDVLQSEFHYQSKGFTMSQQNPLFDPQHSETNIENMQILVDKWNKYRMRVSARRIYRIPILGHFLKMLVRLRNMSRMWLQQRYLYELMLRQFSHIDTQINFLSNAANFAQTAKDFSDPTQRLQLGENVKSSEQDIVNANTPRIAPSQSNYPESQYQGYTNQELHLLEKYHVDVHPKAGYVASFLGSYTKIDFFKHINHLDGVVEGLPIPGNFHAETVEWIGSLKAVDSAVDTFCVAEIGAGWGPWLVDTACAARTKGITDIYMVGVEADDGHFLYLQQHLADNGFEPRQYRVLHGIVGEHDGEAFFPIVDSQVDWGAAAIFSEIGEQDVVVDYRGLELSHQRLQCYSLLTIFKDKEFFDLCHVDVQGAEFAIISASRETLKVKVRFLIIGTHSRKIEGDLFELLSADGWILENEKPCLFGSNLNGDPINSRNTKIDGVQVWRNPKR